MVVESIPPGVIATLAVSALGGLIGGALTTARRNLIASILIGTIVGMSAAIILRLLDAPTLVDVEGYPLVWSGVAGLLAALVVSSTTR